MIQLSMSLSRGPDRQACHRLGTVKARKAGHASHIQGAWKFAALDFHSREAGHSSIDEKGTDTQGHQKSIPADLGGAASLIRACS